MEPLTPRDRVILAFEDQHRESGDRKDDMIRTTFGWSPVRYYQHLNRIIDEPAALTESPMLVRALLNARHRRTETRAQRTFAA